MSAQIRRRYSMDDDNENGASDDHCDDRFRLPATTTPLEMGDMPLFKNNAAYSW